MSSERTLWSSLATRASAACLACVALLLTGCPEHVSVPEFGDDSLLIGAAAVPAGRLALLEGMLRVPASDANRPLLGETVAVAAAGEGVSFFAGTDVYAVTRAGCLDAGTRLVLEGHWREAHTTRAGLMQVFVEPAALAQALCADPSPTVDPTALRFTGWLSERGRSGRRVLSLEERSPLRPHDDFYVIAHRGGCRTSDDCGASENSVEVIRLAESFGADGIEIDAIATADGVPILYHDEAFSARLVRGTYCYGPVSDFPLAHVRALCTLEHGEPVPTLEEALRAVIDETTLGGVWIDVKDARSLPAILAVTEAARAHAASVGRSVTLLYGLYSDELVAAYLAAAPPPAARCLVELSPADVVAAGCQVWAPRWTRGTMAAEVRAAQDRGLVVGFWTVDEREFLDRFLTEARPNALLTNRPGLAFHRFQTVGASPAGPAVFPLP
jgi:glycerophosphoryl diester phosphodiesterase